MKPKGPRMQRHTQTHATAAVAPGADKTARKAAGPEASYAGWLDLSVVQRTPERVQGEMRVTARHRDAAGDVHMGVIVGFAQELAGIGARMNAAAGTMPVPQDTKTLLFSSSRTAALGGEAVPLHRDETGAMLWQTTVYDADAKPVAIVAHTVIVRPAATEPAGPALPDDAAARIAALAEPAPKAAPAGTVAEQRREQIAKAACDVIARKGFAGATIREIADAAGLHVPTMYQYVSSKDEVLELVYSWAMERLRTDVDMATVGCITSRDKLICTLTSMIDNGDRYRRQVGVLNRELKSLPQKSRLRVLAEYQTLLRRIGDLVREGIDNGEFRAMEPEIVASIVESMADLWPLRQFAMAKFGLEHFREEILRFVEAALVVPPPR